MIKTVYFDLGNVLVFFSMEKMFQQISQVTGLSPTEAEKNLFQTGLREHYEKGLIDTENLYQTFLSISPKTFSLQEFTFALSNIFTPNKEIWPVVEELKKQKIRLVLLSNTSECHFNYVNSQYPILQVFDHKILSYELGVWKPELEIFQKALQYSQCAKEECFYIDDVPDFIEKAKKVGLDGEVYLSVPQLKEQLIARGLHFF
jgi:HAD superfamily hydrolase (TIGR01509 family)